MEERRNHCLLGEQREPHGGGYSWTKTAVGGVILCAKNRTKHGDSGTCKKCLKAGKCPVSQEQRSSVGVEDKIRLEEWARPLRVVDSVLRS